MVNKDNVIVEINRRKISRFLLGTVIFIICLFSIIRLNMFILSSSYYSEVLQCLCILLYLGSIHLYITKCFNKKPKQLWKNIIFISSGFVLSLIYLLRIYKSAIIDTQLIEFLPSLLPFVISILYAIGFTLLNKSKTYNKIMNYNYPKISRNVKINLLFIISFLVVSFLFYEIAPTSIYRDLPIFICLPIIGSVHLYITKFITLKINRLTKYIILMMTGVTLSILTFLHINILTSVEFGSKDYSACIIPLAVGFIYTVALFLINEYLKFNSIDGKKVLYGSLVLLICLSIILCIYIFILSKDFTSDISLCICALLFVGCIHLYITKYFNKKINIFVKSIILIAAGFILTRIYDLRLLKVVNLEAPPLNFLPCLLPLAISILYTAVIFIFYLRKRSKKT